MGVAAARARTLAMSFEGVSEKAHFDRIAFRTPRRIFATLAKTGADLNLMLDRPLQEFFCEQAPEAMAPVAGGWGEQGATRCDLRRVDEDTLLSALKAAHALASAPGRVAKKSAKKTKRSS